MKQNNIFKFDLLILAIIAHNDAYGYEISSIVSEKSGGTIVLKEGVLYPLLYKLESAGLIRSYKLKTHGRMRVYYKIEQVGMRALAQQKEDFQQSILAIQKIIGG